MWSTANTRARARARVCVCVCVCVCVSRTNRHCLRGLPAEKFRAPRDVTRGIMRNWCVFEVTETHHFLPSREWIEEVCALVEEKSRREHEKKRRGKNNENRGGCGKRIWRKIVNIYINKKNALLKVVHYFDWISYIFLKPNIIRWNIIIFLQYAFLFYLKKE